MQTGVREFDKAISLIKDIKLAAFVFDFLKRRTNSKFFIAPSSSTEKYHPPEDNGKGGLVRHTVKAIQIAICLSRLYEITTDQKDLVIAAVILHDTYKNCKTSCWIHWGDRTNYYHGKIGAHAIREYGMWMKYEIYSYVDLRTLRKINYVARLVEKHMSNWAKPKIYKAKKQNLLERIVIEADYLASRKGISFIINNLLEGEK